MPFIPENDLEQALVKASHDAATAPDFYRLLLGSDLLVLGSVDGQEEATDEFNLAPGGRVNLVTGIKDGVRFLPVFSSVPRMQAYVQEESKYLRVNGRALLDLTRGAPVTLNPGSDYGKELTPEEVRHLLDGPRSTPRMVMGEVQLPPGLAEALAALFVTRPDIETGWMIMVTSADQTQPPHPLVGIAIDTKTGGDWPSLMQSLRAVAEKSSTMFDVQRVDPLNPAGLTGVLLQSVPIYVRRALN
jgi:hypothetical protein